MSWSHVEVWSYSRCYSDAEGHESSTDDRALTFTATIFQWTHTWNITADYWPVMSIVLTLPVLLDMVLIQWHRQTAFYMRNTHRCWNTKLLIPGCRVIGTSQATFSFCELLSKTSEHSSASQYSNDTKNIKISLLCLLTSPPPSLNEWLSNACTC